MVFVVKTEREETEEDAFLEFLFGSMAGKQHKPGRSSAFACHNNARVIVSDEIPPPYKTQI